MQHTHVVLGKPKKFLEFEHSLWQDLRNGA
jgi:hypothetical protein